MGISGRFFQVFRSVRVWFLVFCSCSVPVPFLFLGFWSCSCSCSVRVLVLGSGGLGPRGLSLFLFRSCSGLGPFLFRFCSVLGPCSGPVLVLVLFLVLFCSWSFRYI